MHTEKYLLTTKRIPGSMGNRPHMHFASGGKMSVQDGDHHYCVRGKSVEVGFPESLTQESNVLLAMHGTSDGQVYGHVPYRVVDAIISLEGGIVEDNDV